MKFAELHSLEPYDIHKLKLAKDTVQKVYEYHYGDSYMRKEVDRLYTIVKKLEEIIEIGNNENKSKRNS